MTASPVGLREVIPNQTVVGKAKEFTINTGGAQSTLQDVKLPDSSGGFTYEDQSKVQTRNRFIFWRVSHDVLELTEVSLDWELTGSCVKYRFQDTHVLCGVTIHETFHHIIVLVATVSSVHKLTFPHPNRMHKQDFQMFQADGIPSVFAEANGLTPKESFHILPNTGVAPLPHTSASWLDSDDEAIFALANPVGHITLVKLGNINGIVTVHSLKSSSYLGRLWGTVGGMLSTSRPAEGSDAALSLAIHSIQNDVYIFALCKDHKMRMWLASSNECVMVADVLANPNQGSGAQLQQGSQSHMLRKVTGNSSSDNFALAAFLCFDQQSQFCIFKPVRTDGQFGLKHLATVYAPEFDLIDFAVTPQGRLTAIWTNPDGLPVLRGYNFGPNSGQTSGGDNAGWNDIILEEPLDPEFLPLGQSLVDPRQSYLKQLFYPGRFSLQTLAKTVGIYQRSADVNLTHSKEMTMSQLREDICAAVEMEIQSQVTEYEISDDEHISISQAAWARFYSCAIQYHESGLKPMGLIIDGTTGLMVIVKKNNFSFVRPVDALEHLVLSGGLDCHGPSLFAETPILCEDPALASDIVSLMKAIALVGDQISPKMMEEFSHGLFCLASPDQIAKKIVSEILTEQIDEEETAILSFTQELATKLDQVGDVAKALEVLLYSLELDRGIVSHANFDPTVAYDDDDLNRFLFASGHGRSVLAESLQQMVLTRFELTRNLICLQMVMLECGFADDIAHGAAEAIHSTYLPRSVVMAHCYFVLSWLTETTATPPPPDSLEQGLRQMAVLRIAEKNSCAQQVAEMARNLARSLTLSELFLSGPGAKARMLLTSDTDNTAPWHSVLMPLVNICAQLLWPRCAVSSFQEFLLSACQYMQIQEYVRLLSTWCDWNCHSRQFLLGSAHLSMGEPDKACDWMIQAVGGVGIDAFLTNHLFKNQDHALTDLPRLQVTYFLKIIHLFEQFGYYDHVIELAKAAMVICDHDNPDRTTLCYIMFSHHLRLGHYEKAYDAMVSNPDKSRRKDSLRQFIVTLFERKQLKLLASFPYIDMFEDLETIIESRARSVDLNVNNYYDFLYSFHISKENYRKAAYVMYECAMRLGTETYSHAGLKQQAKCYLACLNVLKLVNPNYAWIVKPVFAHQSKPSASLNPGVSPKHNIDGDILTQSTKKRMDVLEMKQIENEFLLVSARLKLTNKKETSGSAGFTGPTLSANETLALLISANLYGDAVQIAKAFDLDRRGIVEGLASKCVKLSRAKATEQDAAWEWLKENTLTQTNTASTVEAAWSLLQDLVKDLERERQSQVHRAVASRLFSLGASLPTWLVADYKKANPAELLRLFLNNGFLDLAGNFAIEYIAAALGKGKEYFGFTSAIHATAPPVWLPFNLFDQLMLELQDHISNPHFKKVFDELNSVLNNYMTTVAQVSKDMVTVQSA